MSKQTLKHQTETGEVATRTTAKDYTHVLVVDGHRSDYYTAEQLKSGPEFGSGTVEGSYADENNNWISGTWVAPSDETVAAIIARQNREPRVLSWHGSEALAVKAQGSAVNSNWLNPRVEAVNGGTR